MKPEKYARKIARERMDKYGESYKVALKVAYEQIRRRNATRSLVITHICVACLCVLQWALLP